MEDELIEKLQKKGLVAVVQKKCHDSINRIISSYRERVIYVDPTASHLVYYDTPKSYLKDKKKNSKNGKKESDVLSNDEEHNLLCGIGEPKGYIPLKFITEVSEYVKGKYSKPRNVILKCENESCIIKFSSDEIGSKWSNIFRYLIYESQKKTNHLVEYLTPNHQLMVRNKFWFKTKNFDKTVRAYQFIIIDCYKVYGESFLCHNIVNLKLRKFGGSIKDVFDIKIQEGRANSYLFQNFDEINTMNMATGIIYCQYTPELQILFELENLKKINIIPSPHDKGSFGLCLKHNNGKEVVIFTKNGVLLRNWISLIIIYHLQHNVDDYEEFEFSQLFEVDKSYEVLLADAKNLKYINRDEQFIMKKYFEKLSEKQMRNYSNLKIGSLMQGINKNENLGLKQVGNEIVEIQEISSPTKQIFIENNKEFMKIHSRFELPTKKFQPGELKEFKKQTEIDFDSNIVSNREILENYYDNQSQKVSNEKARYLKQNLSANLHFDMNKMGSAHKKAKRKEENPDVDDRNIEMINFSKKGKLPFRRGIENPDFMVIYHKNGTIAYTGYMEGTLSSMFPTGNDVALFNNTGHRIFRGDITDKKVDKSRIPKIYEEMLKNCKLEHSSQEQKDPATINDNQSCQHIRTVDQPQLEKIELMIFMKPYILKNIIVSSRSFDNEWNPCNPLQKRSKYLNYWDELKPLESIKLRGSDKNLFKCWYYVGYQIHDREHGFGKLYIQTETNDLIRIYEGVFHEGLPYKGVLYKGDSKYKKNREFNLKHYLKSLKKYLMKKKYIDSPKIECLLSHNCQKEEKVNRFRKTKEEPQIQNEVDPKIEVIEMNNSQHDIVSQNIQEAFYESMNEQTRNYLDFDSIHHSIMVSSRQNKSHKNSDRSLMLNTEVYDDENKPSDFQHSNYEDPEYIKNSEQFDLTKARVSMQDNCKKSERIEPEIINIKECSRKASLSKRSLTKGSKRNLSQREARLSQRSIKSNIEVGPIEPTVELIECKPE